MTVVAENLARAYGPVLEALVQPVAVLDAQWRHVSDNGAFRALVGARFGALAGVAPPLPYLPVHPGTLERQGHASIDLRRGDGDTVRCDVRVHSVAFASGEVLGRFLIGQPQWAAPTTHLHRIEAALGQLATELQNLRGRATEPRHHPVAGVPGLDRLSERESEVLAMIADGRRVPAIAAELFLSQHTVRNHLKAIFRKVGVTNQAELMELIRRARTQPLDA